MLPLLLLAAQPCIGQTKGQSDIDEEYKACLAKDTTNATICGCAYTAYGKWDGEMNSVYKKLYKSLKRDKDRLSLKQAQTAWMAFRDAQFKSYDIMFNLPGGKYCTVRQDGRIDIVRARALQLQSYLQDIRQR